MNPIDSPAAATAPPCFVLCEGRASDAIGVKLLLASLRRHAPDSDVLAYISEPMLAAIAADLRAIHPRVRLIAYTGPEDWSCKPAVLLNALCEAPGRRLIWVDVDILVIGDLAPLAAVDASTLIVAEESNPNDNARVALRCERLNLPEASPRLTTISSCVVGVTTQHRVLLERWRDLMKHEAFQLEQSMPPTQRRLFFGDQEVWEVTLCESDAARWPIRWLLNDAEMIQANYTTFRPRRSDEQRLATSATAGKPAGPMFVHATGNLKPWRTGRERLPQEMFPYFWHAHAHLDALSADERSHFRHKSPIAWLWLRFGGGFTTYRAFRRTLRRLRVR